MSGPYSRWDPSLATDEADEGPDLRIVPLIEALRAAGVVTLASCSGHPPVDGTERAGYLMLTDAALTDARADRLRAHPSIWWVGRLPPDKWHVAWLAENFDAAESAIREALLPVAVPEDE